MPDDKNEKFCANGYRYLMQLTLSGLNEPFGIFRCAWKERDAYLDNRLLTEIILDIAIALESALYREKLHASPGKQLKKKNKLLSKFTL